MWNLRRALAVLAVVLPIGTSAAISKISAVGSKFFTEDGNQFYIKGVAYQLTEHDPLVDANQCQLDATAMAAVGANTIRVYHVDAGGDHSGCMKAFADAGIYLFVDLDTFTTQIDPVHPYWNQTQVNDFEAVLDEFQKYDNLAGVFVGNEVLTMGMLFDSMVQTLILLANVSQAAPFVKAAARDVKAYRDSKGYRKIPVGYSAADVPGLRPMLQNYLACGSNASAAIDFFALNAYEWCGSTSTYDTSGYVNLQANATGYPIPIFFSETGCNTVPPRDFADQAAIFGSSMRDTWSGAIIYEWLQETNKYGLVSYPASGGASFGTSGTPTPISPDYTNLKSAWATASPPGIKLAAYTSSLAAAALTTPPCPASTLNGWLVDGDVQLPTIGATYNAAAPQTPVPSVTGSSAAPSATKGSATGGKEITGMTMGLAGVMLGFVVWL